MTDQPPWTEQQVRPAPWWVWLLAALLVGAAFASTCRWLGDSWLGNPQYAHGFLVPLVSVALAWRLQRRGGRGPESTPSSRGAFVGGVVLLGAGLGLHLASLAKGAHLGSSLALVLVLAGVVLSLGGWTLLRRQAFPLAFLLAMIPLPWLETSAPYLARIVAGAAAEMARWLGIEVITAGAQIMLPGTSLTVGAPCSGVSSLAALATLTVLYAFVVQGPVLSRLLLVALAVPIALGANLVRVWLTLLVTHYAGADLALTLFHDWSSPLLFLAALALLIALGKGLRCSGIRSDI